MRACRLSLLSGFAAVLIAALSGPASAADGDIPEWALRSTQSGTEFGVRYWFSMGETSKNLYGGDDMVSRLTYRGLATNSGELFVQNNSEAIFWQAFAGLGWNGRGSLQDEDFPPVIDPYSSTDSDQRGGRLGYATADVGYNFLRAPNGTLGFFMGANFVDQSVTAYGCAQTATNPDVCVPDIDDSTKVITQHNQWLSARLGVAGEARLGDRVKLAGNAAVLPYVSLGGTDAHWLRICGSPGCFTGPIPEDGGGWGYQLETMLSFQVTQAFSLGLGGRYWHMQTSGDTHFEDHVVGGGGAAQPVKWFFDSYGVLAQGSLRF